MAITTTTESRKIIPSSDNYQDEITIYAYDLITRLQELLTEVPPELRPEAFVFIRAFGWDGATAEMDFRYERPFTPEEIAQSNAAAASSEASQRASQEAYERRMLAELKRKYEPNYPIWGGGGDMADAT